ncbi:hypothetical protein ACIRLA_21835 [Streptomyces sp. NPDC102364]|uniref:hypothetical protein n=1 Tax=Streptomyces sp. NPDC102364 TaxID=3366161 RepID=UPI0037F7F1FA
MTVHICSLKTDTPQLIPADGEYHLVHFPFGNSEPSDAHGMHQAAQPDGHRVTNWRTDPRSGLIWPSASGWGSLTAMIFWEDGGYTELRDQFVRDPLAHTKDPVNTTATDHRARSPKTQCFTKHHEMFVHPGTPVALRVAHNDRTARRITLAEFKLAIHPEGA